MGKWSFLLCMLLWQVSTFAQPVQLTIDTLSERFPSVWKYMADDKPEYAQPSYNDSSWGTSDTRLDIYETKDFDGLCWFRLHVNIDSTLAGVPIAVRMTHRGASEIYTDGKLIKKYGYIGDKETTEYRDPNDIIFVMNFDSVGRHVIAVRYANFHRQEQNEQYRKNNGGFRFRVVAANRALDKEFYRLAIVGFVIVFVIGLCIGLALLHMFLFLYYRAERSNIYLSTFCLALAASFLLPYIKGYHPVPQVQMKLELWMLVAMSIIAFSLTGIVYELFSKKKWRFYITSALCIITIVTGWFHLVAGIITFVFVLLIIIMEAFVLTIIAMYNKVKGAKIIGIGILFFCLFFIILIALVVGAGGNLTFSDDSDGGQLLMLFAIMAILSIPISMSVYLAWKFSSVNKDLNLQLDQVKELSEKTLEQEQEKKRILETQKERLEEQVVERTKEIVAEKQKSDDLLLNILPEEVAEELKERGRTEAKYFDHVSVLFTDFVDFTKAGERFTPQELVDELHTCFKAFDGIISKHNIEKIKTIGDAYLAVCGLPKADEQHAINTVNAALEIREFMKNRRAEFPNKSFDVRIGIHSGPVVAGIVGVKKFAYDIWGDTVNTAARMESSSLTDKINISHSTYELVKDNFECTFRGKITAKNKGELRMYFVEGKK